MPRHIIIKLPKIKDKESILKAASKKETVTYRGVPIGLSADFKKRKEKKKPFRQERAGKSIQSYKKQGPISKITLSRKALI